MTKVRLTAKNTAKLIAGFASDKKAEDIVVLDMRKVANFCDYFVVCSANSDRQVKAIADGICQGLEELGQKVRFKQGLKSATWVLLDIGDVVTHIFATQAREFYGLEHLWQDAVKIEWLNY